MAYDRRLTPIMQPGRPSIDEPLPGTTVSVRELVTTGDRLATENRHVDLLKWLGLHCPGGTTGATLKRTWCFLARRARARPPARRIRTVTWSEGLVKRAVQAARHPLSFDCPLSRDGPADDGGGMDVGDTVADPGPTVAETCESASVLAAVSDRLRRHLPPRDYTIVTGCFGLGRERVPFATIGDETGLTPSRARQVCRRVLTGLATPGMRKALGA